MQRQLSEEEISRCRAELATLPIGSISRTEKAFGRIVSRTVLYRGPDFDHACGVSFRNVETFLKRLPDSVSLG